MISRAPLALLTLFLVFGVVPTATAAPYSITKGDSQLQITLGDQAIATYVWQDDELPRPYFAPLAAPNGTPVSRTYPPDPIIDKDNDDHPNYHPGAWMAFGDISGTDFWRNKARVRHLRFAAEPTVSDDGATFTVINAYEETGAKPRVLCEETCTYTFTRQEHGYLLSIDSTFRPVDGPFAFGDQEEMGFGVRVTTPISVRHGGGMIRNSADGKQEAETWGKTADWCAAFNTIDGHATGVSLMASPDNFRPAWFHSRDYGLLVANPFGKKAMTGAKNPDVQPDSTSVTKVGSLRIRFGLYVFSAPSETPPNFEAVYEAYTDSAR